MAFDPIAYLNEPRWHESRLGLERMRELLEGLGRPQDRLRFVHVAGTNGKGSICAFMAQVLQESGFKTGMFTSPYVEVFEERIRIDGCNISPEKLLECTLEVRNVADVMDDHPTEFELMCAVALLHFSREGCDIVVMEVGLGGRFDATNVIESPEVCVIARIGLDHTDILGDTLAKIAAEKAGIIKPGAAVVSWPQESEAAQPVFEAAEKAGDTLVVTDFRQLEVGGFDMQSGMRPFTYKEHAYETQLAGTYQPRNAAVAIDAICELRKRGWDIADDALERGIANAKWPGRFEIVGTSPLFIVDGGHNPQGARALRDTLSDILPDARPVFIMGVLADKDYPAMIESVVDLGCAFVAITPESPRALEARALANDIEQLLVSHGLCASVSEASSVSGAVSIAKILAGTDGVVCTFGSLYSVGAIKRALRN